jgi:hypothetical protein
MRHLISGLVAAVAVMAAAPAMACGYNPCGQQFYAAPVPAYTSSGCNPCGGVGFGYGGYGHARLADPEQQYYYVNQGPTYSGPGAWAPARVYQEDTASGYNGYGAGNYGYSRPRYGYNGGYGYRAHRAYRPYYHAPRMSYHQGYAPRHAYAPRYAPAPYHYGHRVLRRYY